MLQTTVNPTADVGPHAARHGRRGDRWSAQYVLWEHSSLLRARSCGRVRRSNAAAVTIRCTGSGVERRAGFGGYQHCGSVWVCPNCSSKIATARQAEVQTAIERWHARGGRVALVTLTVRHHRHHRLRTVWDTVAKCWTRATSGRGWVDDQVTYGTLVERTVKTGRRAGQVLIESRIPLIRVTEVTHGENGWHVHVHALAFVAAGTSREDVRALGASMFARWQLAAIDAGLPAPTAAHGVDARRLDGDASAVTLADYFAKTTYSAAAEVTQGQNTKGGRHGNRTPFQVLADFVSTGDLDDLDTWHEWEAASKGRRQFSWSPGLRELLGMVDEVDDQDLVDDDQGGDTVVELDDRQVHAVQADRAHAAVLAAAEADDTGVAVRQVLVDLATRYAHWSPAPKTAPRPPWTGPHRRRRQHATGPAPTR